MGRRMTKRQNLPITSDAIPADPHRPPGAHPGNHHPHKPMTRRQQLFALAAQLHELTTEEEREDYPFLVHLQDLIADLEIEED